MTTDKTPATLATAKHGGCVQLPTSERERFEAWADGSGRSTARFNDGGYCDERTVSAWLAWQAALSAQPSPGGQGDALHEAVGRIFGCDGSPWRTRDVAAVLRDYAALAARQSVGVPREVIAGLHDESKFGKAALLGKVRAARQPVRPNTVSDDMMDVVDRLGSEHADVDPRAWDHLLIYAPKDKIAARHPVGKVVAWQHCGENHEHMVISDSRKRALKEGETENGIRKIDAAYSIPLVRQPVGEPERHLVGYMDPDAEFMLARPGDCVLMGQIVLWREPGSKYTKPLYDAPAQAVDLERFRPAVMTALGLSSPYGLERETLNKLLDLIDSQAVANG